MITISEELQRQKVTIAFFLHAYTSVLSLSPCLSLLYVLLHKCLCLHALAHMHACMHACIYLHAEMHVLLSLDDWDVWACMRRVVQLCEKWQAEGPEVLQQQEKLFRERNPCCSSLPSFGSFMSLYGIATEQVQSLLLSMSRHLELDEQTSEMLLHGAQDVAPVEGHNWPVSSSSSSSSSTEAIAS